MCDGAALAGAASAIDLDRTRGVAAGGTLRFADVQSVVDAYLARDPDRADVQADVALTPDARTLSLTCVETRPITFGVLFGQGHGVRHVVTASARAPTA